MAARRRSLPVLGALTLLVAGCNADHDDATPSSSTAAAVTTAGTAGTTTAAGSSAATTSTAEAAAPSTSPAPAEIVRGTVASLTREQVDAAISTIDGLVDAEMQRSGVPGVAVAVVYDDEVVFANGYGVRKVDTADPVSTDTVFQLASVSKPITGTALAALVSDGTITWDEPVHPYEPDLVFSDPWVTDHVTFADLYSHRSGLPDAIGDPLEIFGFTREEILARLRLVPLNAFRASYAYTDFGMTAGGDAAARAAGVPFERMVAEQLFEPAGMTSSTATYADFLARPDRTTLHVKIDGTWVPGPERDPDAQAPAGGISASVKDVATWIRLQLNGGTLDGKRIISEEALAPTHTPQIVKPPAPTYDGPAHSYGLGWNLDQDHLGYVRWAHSGAFTNGASTNVTLLPLEGLGVVVLTNGMPIGVPEALADQIIDQIVTGGQTQDWPAYWDKIFGGLYVEDPALSKVPDPPTPARPLDAYLGSYANDFYGTFEVVADGTGIALVQGPARVTSPLTHWDGDTFTFVPSSASPDIRAPLTFTVGPDGQATAIVIPDPDFGTLERE